MARAITDVDALELIRAGSTGRLGCIDNNEPYVVPINYLLDDGVIYSHSLPGKKTNAMRTHPRVCVQVDDAEGDFFGWRSAIAFGDFEEVDQEYERQVLLEKLLTRFPKLTPVESTIAHDAGAPDSIVFRIVIDRVTGVEEE
jgi:nitroimidazol reductase NimA-like FMN-containing flavoprotein (pyridoxamine 5'-phosphate oxidase superfamily)